jgi:hypothetical protein
VGSEKISHVVTVVVLHQSQYVNKEGRDHDDQGTNLARDCPAMVVRRQVPSRAKTALMGTWADHVRW